MDKEVNKTTQIRETRRLELGEMGSAGGPLEIVIIDSTNQTIVDSQNLQTESYDTENN